MSNKFKDTYRWTLVHYVFVCECVLGGLGGCVYVRTRGLTYSITLSCFSL